MAKYCIKNLLLKVLQMYGSRGHFIFGTLLIFNLILLWCYITYLRAYNEKTLNTNFIQEVTPVLVPSAYQVIATHTESNYTTANTLIEAKLSDATNTTGNIETSRSKTSKNSTLSSSNPKLVLQSINRKQTRRRPKKYKKQRINKTLVAQEKKNQAENFKFTENADSIHMTNPFHMFPVWNNTYNQNLETNTFPPFSFPKYPQKIFIHKAMIPPFTYEPNLLMASICKGRLTGVRLKSRNGTPYWAYFGIPYAKPPVGPWRFQPPQEPNSWSGLRDATKPTMKCLQWDKMIKYKEIGGSEDCLYLNVFTPSMDEKANIPVMVCIHSGAFLRGESTECFPTYFMDKRIIMVSFDYRLGLLGFVSAGDEILPGNYGIKDQVAVLRWVKKNIRYFGGNPDSVTIFGQSAGAASVHLHMYSPLSSGLFHRAISQSGTAIAPWVITPKMLAKNRTNALGILTGCPLSSTEILVNCLREIPAEELLQVYPRFYIWNCEPTTIFSVVVEPDVPGAFLTKHPSENKEVNEVPWILGITSGEGGIVASDYLARGGELVMQFNERYTRYMPFLFYYAFTASYDKIRHITEKIKKYYFGNNNIGFMTAFQLRDMVTDGEFAHSSIKSALRYNGTRYFYYYDHLNDRSFNEVWGDSIFMKYLGVSHGDDLISLFPIWIFPALNLIDYRVSVRMIDYWTNFAYHGDPNSELSPKSRWEPVSSSELEYLHINTLVDVMENRLLRDRYEFWDRLPLVGPSDVRSKLNEEVQQIVDAIKLLTADNQSPKEQTPTEHQKDEL